MCSFLVQIIYGVVAVVTLILTGTSLGLDAWQKAADGVNSGLLCDTNRMKEAALASTGNPDATAKLLKEACPMDLSTLFDYPLKVKLVLFCLILAIVMEVVCIAYNFFTAFACCCKDILLYVLLAFTLAVVLLLIIVVASAASLNSERLGELQENMKNVAGSGSAAGALGAVDGMGAGKSFFISVVAMVFAIGNAIVCGVAIFCAKKAV